VDAETAHALSEPGPPWPAGRGGADLRGLRRPPRRRPAGARRRRWLAPAAAALAGAAVIGVLAGVGAGAARRPAPAAAGAGMPRFYVTLVDGGSSTHPDATIRASATGAMLGRVSVPGTHFAGVTAAADDRSFVLAAYRRARGPVPAATFLYRLVLTARGRPQRLSKLALTIPAGPGEYESGSMALSADGATLGLVVMPVGLDLDNPGPSARIEVVALRTGRVRAWTMSGPAEISSLWWVRAGTLAFLSQRIIRLDLAAPSQLRFLDTARPPGSLVTASRPARISVPAGAIASALVTGRGRVIVAWTRAPDRSGQAADVVLSEYSVATGARLRRLYSLPSRGAFTAYAEVWSADPSGEHLLISGSAVTGLARQLGQGTLEPVERAVLRRIDHGRVTALPDPAALGPPAAAW
jgi:hypothetical protein